MKETLTIFSHDFLPTEMYTGGDVLHGKQVSAISVEVKIGSSDVLLQTIRRRNDDGNPLVLAFYDVHGIIHETPILFAHALDTHADPYPHESVAVYVVLTEEQKMALTPPDMSAEFGY